MKSIKIQKKEYALNFGTAALADIYDILGFKYMGDGFNTTIEFTLKNILQIAYTSMKHGARVKKESFNMSYEDVCDLFDDNMESLSKIMEMFTEAQVDDGKK